MTIVRATWWSFRVFVDVDFATHFVLVFGPFPGVRNPSMSQDLSQNLSQTHPKATFRPQNKRASDRKSLTLLSFIWRARFELPTTKFVGGVSTPAQADLIFPQLTPNCKLLIL
jgi:hypothetical protein